MYDIYIYIYDNQNDNNNINDNNNDDNNNNYYYSYLYINIPPTTIGYKSDMVIHYQSFVDVSGIASIPLLKSEVPADDRPEVPSHPS